MFELIKMYNLKLMAATCLKVVNSFTLCLGSSLLLLLSQLLRCCCHQIQSKLIFIM